jgi:hypothetical protein
MPHFTHLFKGDILYPKQHALCYDCWGHDDEDNPLRWVTFCPDFPNLFRPLKWWEGLAIDELPVYVKLIFGNRIGYCHKVVEWVGVNSNGVPLYSFYNKANYLSTMCLSELLPATEAEYQEYITKLNGK